MQHTRAFHLRMTKTLDACAQQGPWISMQSAASAALRGGLSKSVYFSRAVLNVHGVGNGSVSEAGAPFGMDRAKE